MELKRLAERIWYMPYEEERDRPNLCYIKGDRWSLAVDAGHSAAHVREFYALLEKENLPLPGLTVLTHWHWDHTFGMHAVNGLTLANGKTNGHLAEWEDKIEKNGPGEFLAMDESIRREYGAGTDVIVRKADMVFSGEAVLDPGGYTVRVIQAEAPHTDDSTLIYAEQDRILFLGDCTCRDFYTGVKSPDLCRKLADTIREIRPAACVEGHWVPVDPEDTLQDLMSDMG